MYLDSAILVKLLVREPDSLFYADMVDGQIAWSAELALSECFSALLRKEREGAVTPRHRKAAWRQLEDDVNRRRLNLVGTTRSVLESANAIMAACHPTVALRSLDAVHLAAAAQCVSWPLCTNDTRMRDAATRLGFPLSPLPGAR
jgi:predicted nucleic acid-binding protein